MFDQAHMPGVAVIGMGAAVPNDVPLIWPSADELGGSVAHTGPKSMSDDAIAVGTGLGRRELKKMDRMAMLAVCAARAALTEVAFTQTDIAACGILTGNTVGGWTFTEPQLRMLYNRGVADVSPYLASAWFPAASQGQVSIHMQVKGYAKTVATDRCAGTQAIGIATDAVRAHRGPNFLAGGVEAPLTPFVEGAAASDDERSPGLTEGAAYLVLGTHSPSRRKVAEVTDHMTFTLPSSCNARLAACERKLRVLYERNGRSPEKFDLLLDSGRMTDRALIEPMRRRNWVRHAWWTADIIGNALAASGPIVAAAICRRYACTPDHSPAIILSLGHDFACALVLRAPQEKMEECNAAC